MHFIRVSFAKGKDRAHVARGETCWCIVHGPALRKTRSIVLSGNRRGNNDTIKRDRVECRWAGPRGTGKQEAEGHGQGPDELLRKATYRFARTLHCYPGSLIHPWLRIPPWLLPVMLSWPHPSPVPKPPSVPHCTHTSHLLALTTGLLAMARALSANRSVEQLSSKASALGLSVASSVVRQFPPRESCSRCVSRESRYGTCGLQGVGMEGAEEGREQGRAKQSCAGSSGTAAKARTCPSAPFAELLCGLHPPPLRERCHHRAQRRQRPVDGRHLADALLAVQRGAAVPAWGQGAGCYKVST